MHFFSEIPFYLELKGQDSYKKGQDQLALWPTDQDKSPFCEACSSGALGGRKGTALLPLTLCACLMEPGLEPLRGKLSKYPSSEMSYFPSSTQRNPVQQDRASGTWRSRSRQSFTVGCVGCELLSQPLDPSQGGKSEKQACTGRQRGHDSFHTKAAITGWSVTADSHAQTGPNKEGTFPNNNISILLQKGALLSVRPAATLQLHKESVLSSPD